MTAKSPPAAHRSDVSGQRYERLIRCPNPDCNNILGAVIAGQLSMTISVRSGRRREVSGDMRFLNGITCENCGTVWRPER